MDKFKALEYFSQDELAKKVFIALAERPGSGYTIAQRLRITTGEFCEKFAELQKHSLVSSLGPALGGFHGLSDEGVDVIRLLDELGAG